MAVTVDYSDCLGNGWRQYRLFYVGDLFEISNALKIGFWVWVPEEANANEIDLVLTFNDKEYKVTADLVEKRIK